MQLYIHVPFCKKKCHYCGFYSEPVSMPIPAHLFQDPKDSLQGYHAEQTVKAIEDAHEARRNPYHFSEIGINLYKAKEKDIPQDLIDSIIKQKFEGASQAELSQSIATLSSYMSNPRISTPIVPQNKNAKIKKKKLNSSQAFGEHPKGVLSLADILKSKKNTHITDNSSSNSFGNTPQQNLKPTGPTLADALLPKEQAQSLRQSFGLPNIQEDRTVQENHVLNQNPKRAPQQANPQSLASLLAPQKEAKITHSPNKKAPSTGSNTPQAPDSILQSPSSLQNVRSLIAGDSTGFMDMDTANEFIRTSLKGQNINTLNTASAMAVPRALPSDFTENNPLSERPIYQLWKKALLAEIKIISENYQDYFENEPITSIFFGGGTPSFIPVRDLSLIVRTIIRDFPVTQNAEISMEANPESMTPEKAKAYAHMGFNRISLGVQSLQDNNLQNLGRVHSSMNAIKAFHMLRQARFHNISIDLMWGLPNQKNKNWRADLREVINLAPEHISCYGLSIDDDSYFHDLEQKGELPLPDEDEQALMYKTTVELLEHAGYLQYEISNFAKIGYQCRHNMGYWHGANYLGFGPSAASTVENVRRTHARSIVEWAKDIQHGLLEKDITHQDDWDTYFDDGNALPVQTKSPKDILQKLSPRAIELNPACININVKVPNELGIPSLQTPETPYFTKEVLSKEEQVLECIMLRLRTTQGLSFAEYKKFTGRSLMADHKDLIESCMNKNLLRIKKSHVFLSPSGMLISNTILERFFEDTRRALRKYGWS